MMNPQAPQAGPPFPYNSPWCPWSSSPAPCSSRSRRAQLPGRAWRRTCRIRSGPRPGRRSLTTRTAG